MSKTPSFKERAELYIKSSQRAQKRYRVSVNQVIVFGEGTHTPFVGKIALYLLRYSKARIIESIQDVQEKEPKKKKK